MKNKIDHITPESSLGCFKLLSDKDLEVLNDRKTQISYLKGETIFKQGAFAPHVLFVNQGLVRVYLQTAPNKQLNISLAQKSDFLAFSAVFGENIHHYSASALVDCTICMIDKLALKNILLGNPEFALQISSRNMRIESRYMDIISNLSYKQMRGKLASALLYLSGEEFANEEIFSHLNRQVIADFASITSESAIKFMKEFEREGIIKLDGKRVDILKGDELLLISKNG
jgi:CRP-like cAMP-binding protein